MIVALAVSEADYAFSTPVELPGPSRTVTVLLRFRWLDRYGVWAMTPYVEGGDVALGMQQIVRAGGRVLLDRRDPRGPEGLLRWEGADVYAREGLGSTVRLRYEVR